MKNCWEVCTQIPYFYFPPKINKRFFKNTTKKQLEKDRKFAKSFINDITSTLVSENAELTTEEEQSNKQNDEAKIWVPKPRGHYCRVCNVDF